MIVVVHHMPLLLYGQVEIPEVAGALDILEKGLDLIVGLGARKAEVVGVALPMKMEVWQVGALGRRDGRRILGGPF
jgi:hypothetical protein